MAAHPARAWFRGLPRPLRWALWLAVGVFGFLLVLSLALAIASNRFLRPLVEEQASIAIPGEVEAASLEIGLFGGQVTVEGLSIRPEPGAEPVVEVGRLHLSLARLPLLLGRVVVRKVEVDAPKLRVVRLPNGEIDLLRVLVPETPPTPEPPPPPSEPIPIRVDSVQLEAGRIEFVDEAQPGAEPLAIELPTIRVENLVVTGDPDEDPAELRLEIGAEGASIELGGRLQREGDRIDLDATLDIEKLPIGRGRVYLPDLGWSELDGRIDASLHYVHVSGSAQSADGTLALRDLRVGVPGLADPAFALASLEVGIEKLDLLGRRLALEEVEIAGLRIFFDPADPAKLPLLPKGLPAAAETSDPPAPAEAGEPFTWSLGRLAVSDSELVAVRGDLAPFVLDASIESLASDAATPASLELSVGQGEGKLALAGKAAIDPVGFHGKLGIEALALAPLARGFAGEAGEALASATAAGEIRIGLGSLLAGEALSPGGDLHAEGTFTISGIEAEVEAGAPLLAKLGKLELAVDRFDVPGLLAPPAASAGSNPPVSAGSGQGAPEAIAQATDPPAAAAPASEPPPPPPGSSGPLRWEAPADAGSVRFAGTLRLSDLATRAASGEPLAAEFERFEIAVKDLEIAKLLVPSTSDGKPASSEAGSLRLEASTVLSAASLESGKDAAFGVEIERFELGVHEVLAPGLLAPVPPEGASPQRNEAIRVALDRLRVATPRLRVTRTDRGIVLPSLGSEAPTEAERTPAKPAAPDPKPSRAGESSTQALRVELASLAIENGSLRFVDRTVKPFYQGDVTALQVKARDVAFPGPRARDVSIRFDAPGPAPFWAIGAYTPPDSWFEMNLEKLPLAPLNPFVQSAAGYVVNRGELSLYSKGSESGGKLAAANWITLYDPSLSGGSEKSPLEAATGVPVSLAISLLEDPAGNIGLSIPIEYDDTGTSIGIGSVIGSAVKQVLLGALTSPLKLVGAVVDAGGRVKDATPQPIGFLPGRDALAEGAVARVDALAKLLATRPGIAVALRGQSSGSDGQFAREAALARAIESGEGLPEAAQGLGNTLLRRRVRAALEARLAGEPEALDPEDSAALDAWLSAIEISPEAMTELATTRARTVRAVLEREHGIDVARVSIAEAGAPGASPEPAVDVLLEP